MKKYFIVVAILFFNHLIVQGQNQKNLTDSLVKEWNERFNADIPEKMEEIFDQDVVYLSGNEAISGRDSVMSSFVKKRMPVIFDLLALNDYHTTSNEMIFTAGRYTLNVRRSETEVVTAGGNYTLIWKLQRNKQYKIVYIHIESVPKKK